jgi:hypothetical protein
VDTTIKIRRLCDHNDTGALAISKSKPITLYHVFPYLAIANTTSRLQAEPRIEPTIYTGPAKQAKP